MVLWHGRGAARRVARGSGHCRRKSQPAASLLTLALTKVRVTGLGAACIAALVASYDQPLTESPSMAESVSPDTTCKAVTKVSGKVSGRAAEKAVGEAVGRQWEGSGEGSGKGSGKAVTNLRVLGRGRGVDHVDHQRCPAGPEKDPQSAMKVAPTRIGDGETDNQWARQRAHRRLWGPTGRAERQGNAVEGQRKALNRLWTDRTGRSGPAWSPR